MKNKAIITISIIFIIIGLSLMARAFWGNKQLPYQIVQVARGDIVQRVSVTGTVEPKQKIDLQFETSGRLAAIEVKVGQQVDQGQALIRLEASELLSQRASAQASLSMAQAQLTQILEGVRPEEIALARIALENAENDLAHKQHQLAEAEEEAKTTLSLAYKQASNLLIIAQSQMAKALRTYQDLRQKYFAETSSQTGSLIKEQLDIAEHSLSRAEECFNQANYSGLNQEIDLALEEFKKAVLDIKQALGILRQSMDEPIYQSRVLASDESLVDSEISAMVSLFDNLSGAQNNITSTKMSNQNSLEQAQANLDLSRSAWQKASQQLALKEAGSRQSDIDLARSRVAQAQAALNQIEQKISKRVLRAPVKGIVTEINQEVGELAVAGQPVISMITASPFQIKANVAESEIAKIKVGNSAIVTLDALGPTEKFKAELIEIAPAETVISGVIYYQATFVFDQKDERIKSGMTANLEIETAKKENVLYLPYYALNQEGDRSYVLVLTNGQPKKQFVRIGLEGETEVEIISGLNQGDQVLIKEE